MSFNPEQYQRLKGVFSTMPELGKALTLLDSRVKTSEWLATPQEARLAGSPETFKVDNGAAALEFRISTYWDYLEWRADLPDFLQLGRKPEQYQRFLRFFQNDFPNMLFGYVPSEEQRPIMVDLYPQSLRPLHFDLETPRGRAGLLTQFVDKPNRDCRMLVGTQIGESFRPYCFEVVADQGVPSKGSMSIALLHKVQAGWNDAVLDWALATHVDGNQIGDATRAVSNLRDILHSRIGASTQVPKPTILQP